MARITDKEKERFHFLLDIAMEKLDSFKNIDKPHWNTLSLQHIQKMITVENGELDVAILDGSNADKYTELKDILLYTIFALDNITP
jgi:hypothetical protein